VNHSQLIQEYESKYLKEKIPTFQIGDTVKVHTKIVEGQKERVQVFEGVVIARKGTGLSETFTVYRIAYGSSMERLFLLHSPKVVEIEVTRKGKVRRAKLNYIRGKAGKAAKIEEKIGVKSKVKKTSTVAKSSENKSEKTTELNNPQASE
jgi:large subunit ribosomal protein L19